MADENHIAILSKGVKAWNEWRHANPDVVPDLAEADLRGKVLRGVNLHSANLVKTLLTAELKRSGERTTDLRDADLTQADLSLADLYLADVRRANFHKATLQLTQLQDADLRDTDFTEAHLHGANFLHADLRGADFSRSHLFGALLIRPRVDGAKFSGCTVFGVCAWELYGEPSEERGLVLSGSFDQSPITVDSLELAQFLHLLLNNRTLRSFIDVVTSKTVLILGNFKPLRKALLDQIREFLRRKGFVAIMFDWDKPSNQDVSETVMLLAQMSAFVVADLTDPRSVPHELQMIVPNVCKPVLPLVQRGQTPYGMFEGLKKFPWLLPPLEFGDFNDIAEEFESRLLDMIEHLGRDLRQEKEPMG